MNARLAAIGSIDPDFVGLATIDREWADLGQQHR